jgi:hypothetical protein
MTNEELVSMLMERMQPGGNENYYMKKYFEEKEKTKQLEKEKTELSKYINDLTKRYLFDISQCHQELFESKH